MARRSWKLNSGSQSENNGLRYSAVQSSAGPLCWAIVPGSEIVTFLGVCVSPLILVYCDWASAAVVEHQGLLLILRTGSA